MWIINSKAEQIAKTSILLKYTQVNFQCYQYEFPGCVGVEQLILLNNLISTPASTHLKKCSHGAIATTMYSSKLMGFMGFSVIVPFAPCEH